MALGSAGEWGRQWELGEIDLVIAGITVVVAPKIPRVRRKKTRSACWWIADVLEHGVLFEHVLQMLDVLTNVSGKVSLDHNGYLTMFRKDGVLLSRCSHNFWHVWCSKVDRCSRTWSVVREEKENPCTICIYGSIPFLTRCFFVFVPSTRNRMARKTCCVCNTSKLYLETNVLFYFQKRAYGGSGSHGTNEQKRVLAS